MNKWLRVVLLLAFLLVPSGAAAGQVPVSRDQASGGPTQVIIRVAGQQIAAVQGGLAAQGKLGLNNTCEFPVVEVVMSGSGSSFDEVTLTPDKDCRLIVTKVAIGQPPVNGAPQSPAGGSMQAPSNAVTPGGLLHSSKSGKVLAAPSLVNTQYHGYADASFYEQFGIKVTDTHTEISWWDNGSSVWGGQDYNSYCWWRSETGWYLVACTGEFKLRWTQYHLALDKRRIQSQCIQHLASDYGNFSSTTGTPLG